jgi:Ca-activated chloride channel homolog
MRRHSRMALLILISLTCAAAAQDGDPDRDLEYSERSGQPTYHSTVSEVRVTFFATDETNRPVGSIAQSDFAIVDNDIVIRNFRSLTRSEETALDIVVLMDLSESVAPRFRAAMNNLLQVVAREQSIPDDHISIVSFAGIKPTLLCSGGCRSAEALDQLASAKSGGATPLFDALTFAAEFISPHRRAPGAAEARRVIILLSDGNDTISLHSAQDALEAARAAGALIYAIDLGPSGGPTQRQAGSVFLRQLADATGGRYLSYSPLFSQPNGGAAVLSAILDDLRSSYVVTYDLPSHEVGYHSLRLMPTHKLNLSFHSRNGYNYEPSGY